MNLKQIVRNPDAWRKFILKRNALSKSLFKIPIFDLEPRLLLESLPGIPFETDCSHSLKETIALVFLNFPKVVDGFPNSNIPTSNFWKVGKGLFDNKL